MSSQPTPEGNGYPTGAELDRLETMLRAGQFLEHFLDSDDPPAMTAEPAPTRTSPAPVAKPASTASRRRQPLSLPTMITHVDAQLGEGTRLGYDVAIPSLASAMPANDGSDWMVDALCAQVDPEIFFPEKGGSTREAKQVCSSCIVRGKCLEKALEGDERFGIWGGYSERERRRIKRNGGKMPATEHELSASLRHQPYDRIVGLANMLEADSNSDKDMIENQLHEDPVRRTKFVQAMLADYQYQGTHTALISKGELSRLFDYFTGSKLHQICATPSVEARLAREIGNLEAYIDKLCESGSDPLQDYWLKSASTEGVLGVMHVVEAKPQWLKDARLAERRAVQ